MISKLDINNVQIKYIHTQGFKEFLKYNIINLNSFTLSYDNGIDYLGFPLSKELVNDLDISLITLFMEFLFDRFGKDKLWYLSDLNEGYNLKTLKVNREYSETICSFDLLDKIFEYHNVPKNNLLVHTANINTDEYWDYEFTYFYLTQPSLSDLAA